MSLMLATPEALSGLEGGGAKVAGEEGRGEAHRLNAIPSCVLGRLPTSPSTPSPAPRCPLRDVGGRPDWCRCYQCRGSPKGAQSDGPTVCPWAGWPDRQGAAPGLSGGAGLSLQIIFLTHPHLPEDLRMALPTRQELSSVIRDVLKHTGRDVELQSVGLFVDPEQPWLGASPDAIDNGIWGLCTTRWKTHRLAAGLMDFSVLLDKQGLCHYVLSGPVLRDLRHAESLCSSGEGLAAGPMDFSVLLDKQGLCHYVLSGPVLRDLRHAESLCSAGELTLHATAWDLFDVKLRYVNT
ncbi:hypothetical protein MTO96_044997 [Rhipicephalus appendiculatus]